MRILLTGVTGYLGARLAPRLLADGHELVALARRPERIAAELRALPMEVVEGDVVAGRGLTRAMRGVDVAYYLIHSMEPASGSDFPQRESAGARHFSRAARRAGIDRTVYLGGPLPREGALSAHLRSRLEVERILLEAMPHSVAFRASIVIGARSRSFRFLVRLIGRLPLLALPAWHVHRSAPVDERDIVEMLARAAASSAVAGLSLDAAGPEELTYGELMSRIGDLMLVDRPSLNLNRLTLTPIASRIAAVIAGEQHDLIGPLMASLDQDLLPRDDRAAELLGVRRHSLNAAIERALRELEELEPIAAR